MSSQRNMVVLLMRRIWRIRACVAIGTKALISARSILLHMNSPYSTIHVPSAGWIISRCMVRGLRGSQQKGGQQCSCCGSIPLSESVSGRRWWRAVVTLDHCTGRVKHNRGQ